MRAASRCPFHAVRTTHTKVGGGGIHTHARDTCECAKGRGACTMNRPPMIFSVWYQTPPGDARPPIAVMDVLEPPQPAASTTCTYLGTASEWWGPDVKAGATVVCAKNWPDVLTHTFRRELYLVVDVRPLEAAKAALLRDAWQVISFAVLCKTRAGGGTTFRGPTNTMGHVVRKAAGGEESNPLAITIKR
jgi:hypothetical protein